MVIIIDISAIIADYIFIIADNAARLPAGFAYVRFVFVTISTFKIISAKWKQKGKKTL